MVFPVRRVRSHGRNYPGELITYQPTWHHGHAVMRFIPNRRQGPPTGEIPPAYTFTQGGFEFYKHPSLLRTR